MRWRFAVALSAIFAALCGWYWHSGHADGVERVSVSPLIGPADDADFGGFSGYETNGTTRHLLTDRGHLYTLSGEEISAVTLHGIDGAPLGRRWRDAEGLVALGNGRFAVSFEGRHRVDIYDGTTGMIVEKLPLADEFERLGGNSGLEALALSPSGELVAIAERSGASERPFPVFVFDGAEWRKTSISRRGAFLPVGADFGPGGRLYVLERDYLLSGFRSRIRMFEWRDGVPHEDETLLKTRFWTHANLEGIAVFEEAGETYIELISDNNFLPVLASELVRYRKKGP